MHDVPTEDDQLTRMLSVLRARGLHWLEDHPELPRPTWWDALLEGMASLVGPPRRWPMDDADTMYMRSWAHASVQTAEDVAAERGLVLFDISRPALPWWETWLTAHDQT